MSVFCLELLLSGLFGWFIYWRSICLDIEEYIFDFCALSHSSEVRISISNIHQVIQYVVSDIQLVEDSNHYARYVTMHEKELQHNDKTLRDNELYAYITTQPSTLP
jgi:hypothetical protein